VSAQFGWDAAPPLADVVAHLANVVAAYDPRDRLQFVEMASSVYAELSRHDAAEVGRLLAVHDALRDWVWHGDGFARPAKLVAAAPFTDLRPYVYSLPTEMTGSEPTTHTHTHTHTFNGPLSGTTRVSRYQRDKTNLDFTESRDSEWQWHQLGHMQVCTSLHASTPPLSLLQAGCPSCRQTNSVKALKATTDHRWKKRTFK